jgi:hypothetical protein
MWRTIDDFWDNWKELKEHFEIFKRWNSYRIHGAYPDGDMLPLGHLGIKAERGNERMSLFTRDEQYTLMTLWCIFKSPLMFGGDLPTSDSFSLSLISNKEVISMLKNSINNRELFNENDQIAWTADEPAGGDKYLALFNIGDNLQTLTISLSEKLGLKPGCIIKDLWTGSSKKNSLGILTATINAHGAVLYKLTRQK